MKAVGVGLATRAGWLSQWDNRTWDDTATGLRDLGQLAPELDAVALAVTGQGEGKWPIDADGECGARGGPAARSPP